MPPKSRKLKPKVRAESDSEIELRRSSRSKVLKDYKVMHEGKSKLSPVDEHDGESGEESASVDSSASERESVKSDSRSDTCSEVSGDDDSEGDSDLEEQIQRNKASLAKIKDIEKQSRKRISNLERLIEQTDKINKTTSKVHVEVSKKKKDQLRKLKRIEDEIETTATEVANLQKQEDSLSDIVEEKIRSKKKQISLMESANAPSAESTPKTTGEYRNLINELLDVTE